MDQSSKLEVLLSCRVYDVSSFYPSIESTKKNVPTVKVVLLKWEYCINGEFSRWSFTIM